MMNPVIWLQRRQCLEALSALRHPSSTPWWSVLQAMTWDEDINFREQMVTERRVHTDNGLFSPQEDTRNRILNGH
jgi:hypothetical protein